MGRAALLLVMVSVGARAAVVLGDGRDGALEVTAAGTVINRATALIDTAVTGAQVLVVGETLGLAAGDRVLVLQTRVDTLTARAEVGAFSLHQIARVVANRLELVEPLARTFTGNFAQVVTVPQYTSVSVAEGASVVAPAWNGAAGGVLALLVTGALVNDGLLSASGAGFRGGRSRQLSSGFGCSALDEPPPTGAQRGEGALGAYGATGRGANDSGGGGGICQFSGGGGGACLGAGGQGGLSSPDDGQRSVGGQGGLALEPASAAAAGVERGLALGGGGGASNAFYAPIAHGGAGGGAVLIAAATLAGRGLIAADGLDGAGSPTFSGASGGGAAGSIVLEVLHEAQCTLSARGGAGATVSSGGGGGGGGYIALRAASISACPAGVTGGAATGSAQPGAVGLVDVVERDPVVVGAKGFHTEVTGCGCQVAPPMALLVPVLAWARRRRRVRRC